MLDQVLGHQRVIPLIPGVQVEVRGRIGSQYRAAKHKQEQGELVVALDLRLPGNIKSKGTSEKAPGSHSRSLNAEVEVGEEIDLRAGWHGPKMGKGGRLLPCSRQFPIRG